jgi:hypothetical protein
MSVRDIITAAAGAAAATDSVYVEEVFQTHLYTGNGSTQTINNGIDLATKGGLVWAKARSSGTSVDAHYLADTARGSAQLLMTNLANAQFVGFTENFTAFNTNGFSIGTDQGTNNSGKTYASWTFRKQPKFFDIVTYTGTGANRTIPHALGSTPGMIIVKRTDTTSNWQVYHRSLTSAANSIQLNLSAAQASAATVWNSTAPTSSVFSVGTDATVNANGGTYVAYLFAHDAGGFGAAGTDSVVSCGSYTATGSKVTVNLGWEPQFVLIKKSSSTGSWVVSDTMRGMNHSVDALIYANTSIAEEAKTYKHISPLPTGFEIEAANADTNSPAGTTYIYLAIRRGPMKTPTDATKVFYTTTGTTDSTSTFYTSGFPVDFGWEKTTTDDWGHMAFSRLQGSGKKLEFQSTASEGSFGSGPVLSSNTQFTGVGGIGANNHVFYAFRRAPGFFDVVCYTGTGSSTGVNHSLGVTPELKIIKRRSAANDWVVGGSLLGSGAYAFLNTTAAKVTSSGYWDGGSDSATQFSVRVANGGSDASGSTYVAYLFASCPGVSKVGSYTGNGSSQTIDCGFAAGARFVLIKRTDSTGDWYVWDTARGIVSGNDPHLSLNTTAAEVTTDDTIDPASSGFIVNQVSATNVNVSSASYIYLAIA